MKHYCNNVSKNNRCNIRMSCNKYVSLLRDIDNGTFDRSNSLILNMYRPKNIRNKECVNYEEKH